MRTGRLAKLVLVGSLVLFASVAQAAFITNLAILPPPNYDSMVPPQVGKAYKDPVFGSVIARMTDALQEGLTRVTVEYASSDIFNADDSMVRLLGDNRVSFYSTRAPFQLLRRRILTSPSPSDYWWDVDDPNVLYHIIQNNGIGAYHFDTDQDSTVRIFSQFSQLRPLGEDNLSLDGNRLALYADDRFVFIYEFSSDSILATLDTHTPPISGKAIGNLTTTPSGDGVIIGWADPQGHGRAQGEEFFKIQGSSLVFQRQIWPARGHHDVGQDSTGDDYFVIIDSALGMNGLFAVRVSDGRATQIGSFGGGGFWHSIYVSCNSMHNDDYVYVTTYKNNVPLSSWDTWVSELLRVKVSGGSIERIAHHRDRPDYGYWSYPKASVSRSGRYLIFPSNFNRQANESGIPSDYVDTYLINIALSGGVSRVFVGDDSSA
jgi:hypothetical protein